MYIAGLFQARSGLYKAYMCRHWTHTGPIRALQGGSWLDLTAAKAAAVPPALLQKRPDPLFIGTRG